MAMYQSRYQYFRFDLQSNLKDLLLLSPSMHYLPCSTCFPLLNVPPSDPLAPPEHGFLPASSLGRSPFLCAAFTTRKRNRRGLSAQEATPTRTRPFSTVQVAASRGHQRADAAGGRKKDLKGDGIGWWWREIMEFSLAIHCTNVVDHAA